MNDPPASKKLKCADKNRVGAVLSVLQRAVHPVRSLLARQKFLSINGVAEKRPPTFPLACILREATGDEVLDNMRSPNALLAA